MMPEPSVQQQVSDRKTQKVKLLAFLQANPMTLFTQETLAESCGCHVSAVRSRLSELKRDGDPLHAEPQTFLGADGKMHRGMNLWIYVPRPSAPLGRDAGTHVSGQRELFR